MVVIEDKGEIKFYDGLIELTQTEGFYQLDLRYGNEPQEVKRVIDKLKEKYRKNLAV